MMFDLNKEDILTALKGYNNYPEYNPTISKVVTDSRQVQKGSLYVALPGERVDGHDFIQEAIDSGAVLVLSQKKIQGPAPKEVIQVKDTLLALGKLAEFYLKKFPIKRFAVTGSSGKTTTKDMVYYVLREGFRTNRSLGNHNNEVGLPLTVMDLPVDTQVGIFEMGMYTLGEIQYLSSIVHPDIAVITNIGTCHIERLKTRDNIFKAKMEITTFFDAHHHLIVNGDDDYLGKLVKEDYNYDIIKCGLNSGNDLIAWDLSTKDGKTGFRLKYERGPLKGYQGERLEIPAFGTHNIQNALCAIACGILAGMDIPTIARGLKAFKPSQLRMEISEKEGVCIVNDSYNANPESMKAVIGSLSGLGKGRKIGVLGDMLELGELSPEFHREIGVMAAKELDYLILIGKEMEFAKEGAIQEGMDENHLFHFMDNQPATTKILELMTNGDIVLLKGSRGMKLDEIARTILDETLMD